MSDFFDLHRFVEAQEATLDRALDELTAGRKRSHWMWFVFPQVAGLGSSAMAERYAIRSEAEARAYPAHPTLGPNLGRCVDAVLVHDPLDPSALMGWPDDLKLRSSMTLFEAVGVARAAEVLERGYGGQRDAATMAILEGWRSRQA
ncbi:MAG: DUF1810 domain-containing protein [Thioalkalivibrio sp.]|nr:DUF1810 domain-containing protein [Thioalkalivibrio sp.]